MHAHHTLKFSSNTQHYVVHLSTLILIAQTANISHALKRMTRIRRRRVQSWESFKQPVAAHPHHRARTVLPCGRDCRTHISRTYISYIADTQHKHIQIPASVSANKCETRVMRKIVRTLLHTFMHRIMLSLLREHYILAIGKWSGTSVHENRAC